jgi:hypothetical protein
LISDQQEKKSKLLSKDSGGLLLRAASQVWAAYEDLQTGQVTVQDFHLIQENQENFLKIVKIMIERDHRDCVFSESCIVALINVREKEITHFQAILQDVGIFTEKCQYFDGKSRSPLSEKKILNIKIYYIT